MSKAWIHGIALAAGLAFAAGGALAQEMLDKGLVQTFSDRLVDVEATAASPELPMLPGGHRVADRRVVYRGTCASCAAGARAGG